MNTESSQRSAQSMTTETLNGLANAIAPQKATVKDQQAFLDFINQQPFIQQKVKCFNTIGSVIANPLSLVESRYLALHLIVIATDKSLDKSYDKLIDSIIRAKRLLEEILRLALFKHDKGFAKSRGSDFFGTSKERQSSKQNLEAIGCNFIGMACEIICYWKHCYPRANNSIFEEMYQEMCQKMKTQDAFASNYEYQYFKRLVPLPEPRNMVSDSLVLKDTSIVKKSICVTTSFETGIEETMEEARYLIQSHNTSDETTSEY